MSELKSIAKGYMLVVTSWENDGDNYQDTTLAGLSAEDLEFYKDFISYFASGIHTGTPTISFGNDYITPATATMIITELRPRHPNISSELKAKLVVLLVGEEGLADDIEYYFCEFAEGVLGRAAQYDGSFCRCVDSFTVFYLPENLIEIKG